MPEWGTATLLEIGWTICALVGVLATSYGTGIAVRDWRRLPRTARSLQRIAKVFVRYETALLLALVVNTLLGIRALLLPPNPVSTDLGAALAALLFLGSGVFLTVVSIQNRLARHANDRDRRSNDR